MSLDISLFCNTPFALDGNGTFSSVGSWVPGFVVVGVVCSNAGCSVPPGVGATGADETAAPGDSDTGDTEGAGVLGTTGARDAMGADGTAVNGDDVVLFVAATDGATVGDTVRVFDGVSDGCGLIVGSAQASLMARSVFPHTISSCSSVMLVSGIVGIGLFKSVMI
jgi:hypothetical protein